MFIDATALVRDALPASGTVAVSGSMLLGRSAVLPPFVMHIKPVSVPQSDYGARHVTALVLIVEPGRQRRVDPDLVARTLELTRPESQVAIWLAEGKSVREMAQATSCIPSFCKHQITPKTSRYARCSMSMLPNVSINGRIRSSGQLGRWWYSISPCRNSECVRRFTVFAFNQRS